LLVLAFYGDSQTARPWWGDGLLLLAVFAGMYAVARFTRGADLPPPAEDVPGETVRA
ncbi:MAG: OpgC domain-containing protein, partial [Variovorax paradoxus]|nr:OpgC domain-containing protein [Variovorax paradoxus]